MTPDRLVAWRVITRGFPSAVIYAAADGDRAKVLTRAAIREFGYKIAWVDLIARRAPEFDAWIAGLGQERGWDEAYAARCMAQDASGRAGTAPDVPSIRPQS
jgi:hypothetical protein